jgi:hypothetical protein
MNTEESLANKRNMTYFFKQEILKFICALGLGPDPERGNAWTESGSHESGYRVGQLVIILRIRIPFV